MTCRQMIELLLEYCSGELESPLCQQIREHLEICPPCVTYLETYQITIRVSRQLPAQPLPPQLEQRLQAALKALGDDDSQS